MKKKQVIVVKKIDKLNPKKEILISRKVQNVDSIENNNDWKESFVGNPAPQVRSTQIHSLSLSRTFIDRDLLVMFTRTS
jgi:hypothetical protein